MKKKMMSEEALAAMLADGEAPVEEQVVESNAADVVVEDAVDEVVEPEALDTTDEVVEPTALETLTAEFEASKLASEEVISNLEATLVETVGKLDASEAGATELKEIVIGQVSKMRMVLKVAAVDMTAWDVEAVVNEYNTSSEAFMKSLPVGSVVPEKVIDKVESPAKTSLDASNLKSLGFK